MTKKISYESSGVNYDLMDPFKKLAQQASLETIQKFADSDSVSEITEALGESAFIFNVTRGYHLVFVQEGLGTKNLITDTIYKETGESHYAAAAQDTVAAIVNDLITVGAKPIVVNAYFALGDSKWLEDQTRARDLITGWKNACILAGAFYGGGETPTLSGIINVDTIDLAGSSVGLILERDRILGQKLTAGDSIVFIESNGIHANGLTLARKIAEELPEGYLTQLSNGDTYGNSLLRPSHIYAQAINKLLDENIDIHYMVNITGHGWRKLMRAKKDFTYVIDEVPEKDPLFEFIQEKSGLSDEEMFGTFNMGAGFAIILPQEQADEALKIINNGDFGFRAWKAGKVQAGEKQVIIKPLGITFKSESLNIR